VCQSGTQKIRVTSFLEIKSLNENYKLSTDQMHDKFNKNIFFSVIQ